MEKKGLRLWVPVLVIAAALLMMAVSTGTVDAARGGKGGRGGNGGDWSPSVTMAVSPNPPPPAYSGQIYTVNGTGFLPGAGVNFVMGSTAKWAVADASGFASSAWQAWTPGTYTVYAKQLTSSGFITVGSITYTIK